MKRERAAWHALFFCFFLCACTTDSPPAQNLQTDGVRFRGALEMNNLYEKAFLYHKHCLKESEEINSVFLKNYEETAKTLFDECVAVKKWSPARAHDEILNRRAYLSHLADTVYAKSGCASRDALNVARYYRAFSSTGATDIK